MEIFIFIQKVFVFLIPGAIFVKICEYFIPHKEKHYYFQLLSMLLLSCLLFLITDIILLPIKLIFNSIIKNLYDMNIFDYIFKLDVTMSKVNFIIAIILSIILSIITIKFQYNNFIFKFLNKLKISFRVSNKDVWTNFIDDKPFVVIRDMLTENVYYGTIIEYSDDSAIRELSLKNVKVFDKESNFLYCLENLYISREHNEFTIEVYNYKNTYKKPTIKGEKSSGK